MRALSGPSTELVIISFLQGVLCTSATLSPLPSDVPDVAIVLGEANFIFQTQALLCQMVHKYGVREQDSRK